MKINVEIDCTPEEARAFLGLPDVQPMQAALMAEIEERMRASLNLSDPEALMKLWLPASAQGFEQLQRFWAQIGKAAQK